jgi:hypothetical protein
MNKLFNKIFSKDRNIEVKPDTPKEVLNEEVETVLPLTPVEERILSDIVQLTESDGIVWVDDWDRFENKFVGKLPNVAFVIGERYDDIWLYQVDKECGISIKPSKDYVKSLRSAVKLNISRSEKIKHEEYLEDIKEKLEFSAGVLDKALRPRNNN